MIIGPGNAGKSTLAVKLGSKLELPVYHLDKYFWREHANWQAEDKEKFRQRCIDLIKKDSWIIEGDFGNTYEMRADAADTIIVLDFPRRVIVPRFFIRVWKYRGTTRPDMAEGNIERINYEYIKWLCTYNSQRLRELAHTYQNTKNVYVFTKSSQVRRFLVQIESSGN